MTDGDDALAKVPDLCLLCLDLRERFFKFSDSLADALVPPVHGGSPAELKLQPGVPLDVGVEFIEHRSHVAAVVGVRHAPNDLDVLLRHRPPSIPLRPYGLRHSFASLLLHEGRSVIYVARQLGHDARYTLGTYGYVMDELEDQPRISADDAIREARVGLGVESRSQSR